MAKTNRISTPFRRQTINRRSNQNNAEISDANILSYDKFDNQVADLELKKLQLFDKAIRSGDPAVIQKAQTYFTSGKNKHVTGLDIKSMLVDPLDYASSFGYKDKPTRLTYYTLRRMASTPFSAITINTRVNQVLKFAVPQPDDYAVGFKIRLRDREAEPTDEDKRNMDKLTQFVLDGGFGGYKWGHDDFENFLAKIIRDSLTFDQYTFEVLEDKRGVPHEFIATDASSYRIAFPDEHSADYRPDPLTGQKCLPHTVQIYNGNIENEFYPWELCFGVRRPRTDLHVNGYGFAELEELVNIITGMLYSDEYNRRFFSQGSAPKGMIRISSNAGINDEALKEFKRQWQMQMSGVYNSWKTPIMEADKMEWIDLAKTNRDMEYSAWQEYLIKIHSALFLIDPSEIGFDIHRSSGSEAMFESDQMKRIKYSRDKGLMPLLKHAAKSINRYMIWRIDDRYEFSFVGGDESEEQALDRAIKEVTNIKQIDEIRAKFDLEPLGMDGGGNLILNPNWMSWYNNKLIREADQQQDMDEGQDFGEEDPDYDPLQEDESEEPEMYEKAIIDENKNPFLKDLNKFIKKLS